MAKIKMWIVLFIVGIVMILGASEFSRLLAEVDRLFLKMYEDRASEKITERNFVMLSSKYQQEQVELEEQIESLREEIRKMEREMIGAEKWIDLIKENAVPKELTATLLNTMIEKILIHAPEIDENGERTQEIEIYYRFVGKID
jgi:hypothetical protein